MTDHEAEQLKLDFIAYQQGDILAFDRFYQLLSPQIWSFVRSRVPDAAGDDLFQEIWVKIHNSRETYQAKYPILPWVFTIVRNALYDRWRKQCRTPEKLNQLFDAAEIDNQDEQFQHLQDEERTFDESLNKVLQATDSLSIEQKQLLDWRYMQDWSFAEIAEKVNKSETNVRKIISRAVQAIRKKVGAV
jgi:RNA polymerase sigma factor (sigma-70 family)